ncbi:MAG: 30S ribosomal protein S18 [Patescibacteria group bacterium]|nr:30S ribosomal protein S18 [Patescibacteria group bacterium]
MARNSKTSTSRRTSRKSGKCLFCSENKIPSFHDTSVLRRFLTERNKIISRSRTSVCAKHQKDLGKNIKYARHLSLLPFTSYL